LSPEGCSGTLQLLQCFVRVDTCGVCESRAGVAAEHMSAVHSPYERVVVVRVCSCVYDCVVYDMCKACTSACVRFNAVLLLHLLVLEWMNESITVCLPSNLNCIRDVFLVHLRGAALISAARAVNISCMYI
jgi:hypothetical protein